MEHSKFWLIFLLLFSFVFMSSSRAQSDEDFFTWISFEQLEDSLSKKPKKTVIFLEADWCVYCEKMKNHAFQNSKVQATLAKNFYAVKMDVETKDTITFGGRDFTNKQYGRKRQAYHELALLFGKRKGKPLSVPVLLILNEAFRVIHRSFEYLTSGQLLKLIQKPLTTPPTGD